MTRVDLPLIDIHTHIGRLPGVVGEAFTPEDLCYIAAHEGALFMLASSASVATVSQSLGTAEAVAMVKRHGECLGGMLWLNPHDPRCFADVPTAVEHGFLGIKIHPQLDNYAVDEQALSQVFSCAREHGWPILTHTGNDGTPISADKYEPLIRAYPEVTLILAHLRLEAIPLARRYDNVYLDTTYVDPMMVEIGVAAAGADKILFGSDAAEGFDVGHPVARARPPRSYAGLIAAIRQRGVSEAELVKITYLNARRLFGLERRGL
jgi:predicted TIM-barrel fold metal-dependent hydrolase